MDFTSTADGLTPQVGTAHAVEVHNVAISCANLLASGETISTVVTSVAPSGCGLTDLTVTAASATINGATVTTGQAFTGVLTTGTALGMANFIVAIGTSTDQSFFVPLAVEIVAS